MPSEMDKWGWEHVSIVGGFDRGSGTKKWKCNHCNTRYNGSYSRVRAHLLGFSGVGVKSCPAIDRPLREAFQILEEERLSQKKKKSYLTEKPTKRVRTSQPTHVSKTITIEDVDDIVARFFYADGLNFNVANSPFFQEMVKTIAAFGPGYEPPGVDKLSDFFLSKEKGRIEKSTGLIRESWPHTACTILCVSTNIYVSSPRGLVFLKSLDTKDSNGADTEFLSSLTDAVMEVGPTNVLQIISEAGYASKSLESVVSSKFPSIFCSPCASSSIHMLMEEIAELEWMKPVVTCAKEIEHCIRIYQHSFPCVLTQNPLGYNSQCITKFAPSYCLVWRIYELKQVLQQLVVSEEWKRWKETGSENFVVIESSILGDELWRKADLFLQIYNPFLTLLSTLDIEKSVMGTVYNWRVQSLEELRNHGIIDDNSFNQLEALIEDKWDSLFSPLHAVGYLLSPKYYGRVQMKSKSVMRGWKAVLDKYESDGAGRRLLREQLSSYWRLEGSLGEEDAVECRDKMDPVAWWENFGFEVPQLQTLAIKVLSQVGSVSGVREEAWEGGENRLAAERLEDLVFVRNNLRLHRQRSGNCLSGQRLHLDPKT